MLIAYAVSYLNILLSQGSSNSHRVVRVRQVKTGLNLGLEVPIPATAAGTAMLSLRKDWRTGALQGGHGEEKYWVGVGAASCILTHALLGL